MFSKCFIIVSEELDIIGLKCSMLCSENISLMVLSGPMDKRTILGLRVPYKCSWVYSWSFTVYLNFKSFSTWEIPREAGR